MNVIAAIARMAMPRSHQPDDAVDERRGLAGSRTRLDEQRVGELAADRDPRRIVAADRVEEGGLQIGHSIAPVSVT